MLFADISGKETHNNEFTFMLKKKPKDLHKNPKISIFVASKKLVIKTFK